MSEGPVPYWQGTFVLALLVLTVFVFLGKLKVESKDRFFTPQERALMELIEPAGY